MAALIIIAPGPDTALLIRNTLVGDRPAGIATSLGIVSGQAVWGLATALGLAAILEASWPAFVAVRIAGGAYLGYLGLRALLSACAKSNAHSAPPEAIANRLRVAGSYRQGLLSNLGNPKMVAFFTGLLPQFVHPAPGQLNAFLLLGLTFSTLTLAWLVLYVVVLGRFRTILLRSRVRRAMNAITGIAMIGLGVRLAAESA